MNIDFIQQEWITLSIESTAAFASKSSQSFGRELAKGNARQSAGQSIHRLQEALVQR